MNSISIITATYNAGDQLPELIYSLKEQTDQNFEWVISDGGSNDRTLDLVRQETELRTVIDSREDCGIYDAINRGIEISNGTYYLVLGADDRLNKNAIRNFRDNLMSPDGAHYDLITAPIKAGRKLIKPRSGKGWLYGLGGEVSGHSVGLMVKKEIHKKFGFYSNKYPICSDQYFVLSAIKGGASINRASFISGYYSTEGFSGQDLLGSLTESFLIKSKLYNSILFQLAIFSLRVVKNYRRL